ncbi:substrate-binding domain-containing protein [Bacillus sp. CGMCC 1.60114]|uniref:substrate-binding domain-containing protein n=1 Tax=unclassified Bacillus (in: firmicutes) TaxID=185979 RepID=UPI00362A181A
MVGYDGTDIAKNFLPNLTTLQQPISDMAERAVKLLDSRINNDDNLIDFTQPLDVKLVEGGTT